MKYIRTKDGRIIFNHEHLEIIDNTLCSMQNDRVWLIIGGVDKQADTIEELCDEFRNITYGKNPEISNPLTYEQAKELKLKDVQRDEFAPNFKTFGAIWTDKGLIYVAKMNDKGELELL